MAKYNKRKTVVEYDNEEGLRCRVIVETFNSSCLTHGEQKQLQEYLVDQTVFALRGAPYLACPAVQRMIIN